MVSPEMCGSKAVRSKGRGGSSMAMADSLWAMPAAWRRGRCGSRARGLTQGLQWGLSATSRDDDSNPTLRYWPIKPTRSPAGDSAMQVLDRIRAEVEGHP